MSASIAKHLAYLWIFAVVDGDLKLMSGEIWLSGRMYFLTALERHLPLTMMISTGTPWLAAVVAAPILNEWDEKRDMSHPKHVAALFSTAWNW